MQAPIVRRVMPPILRGEDSPHWRGNGISYAGAHSRVTTTRGSASEHLCVDCDGPAKEWSYRGGDPAELLGPGTRKNGALLFYSPNPASYDPLCRKCHQARDTANMSSHLNEYRSLLAIVGTPDAGEYIRRTVEQSLADEVLSR